MDAEYLWTYTVVNLVNKLRSKKRKRIKRTKLLNNTLRKKEGKTEAKQCRKCANPWTRNNGQQKKKFEKKNRKENGIETKEVAFTPRDESLSYLLYMHLNLFFLLLSVISGWKKKFEKKIGKKMESWNVPFQLMFGMTTFGTNLANLAHCSRLLDFADKISNLTT